MQQKQVSTKIKLRRILALIFLIVLLILVIFFTNRSNSIKKAQIAKNEAQINISGENIDTSKVISETPNAPQLGAGMIPIKYEQGNWKITKGNDNDWYNYSQGKMATIMLSNGYYKSELEVGTKGVDFDLASEHLGTIIKPEEMGTIYVWIPRVTITKNSYNYLIQNSIVQFSEYSLPKCFTYKQENRRRISIYWNMGRVCYTGK